MTVVACGIGRAHRIASALGEPIAEFADIVLWRLGFFRIKPEQVIKGGLIVWTAMGDNAASLMIWRGSYQGPAAPVDDDVATELLKEARREHRANLDWYRMLLNVPYRDSRDSISGECLHAMRSPNGCLREIAESGTPIYHLAGWFDMFPRDTLLWWANLPDPQKVVIGPWFHVDQHGPDYAAEHPPRVMAIPASPTEPPHHREEASPLPIHGCR